MKQLKLALLSVAVTYAAGWFISLEPNVLEWNVFGRYALVVISFGGYGVASLWEGAK